MEILGLSSCSRSAKWAWNRPGGGCHTPVLQCWNGRFKERANIIAHEMLRRYCRTLFQKDMKPKGGNKHPTKILPGDHIVEPLPWDSQHDSLVIDVSFVCEFMGSSCALWGWNDGARHTHDVVQARANVKKSKYSEVYGLTRRSCPPSQVYQVRYTLISGARGDGAL